MRFDSDANPVKESKKKEPVLVSISALLFIFGIIFAVMSLWIIDDPGYNRYLQTPASPDILMVRVVEDMTKPTPTP